MTTLILLIGAAAYVVLYFTYGKRLEKNVVKADSSVQTPAHRMYDGVDYVPAKTPVLFGHHFSSIAGAAPIVGPVLAMAWGWIPALAWVWFGNIFIGAVHDYLSIMASVRYDGKSVQFVASDLITKRTGNLFYYLVFFLLILVVAAFSAILGGMFVGNGAIPSSFTWMMISALILGVLLYRTKMNFVLSTIIGIVLLAASIYLGYLFPFTLSRDWWFLFMFLYIIIAAAIPVEVLLQPRDYLNSWLLYFGLVIGGLAAIFSFHGFTMPAFSSFSPIVVSGKPSPFWPVIPLIIACGSLSGFHALVGSGTSSKQLDTERSGLVVGYGGMLTEGFLSTLVVVAIAGFGVQLMVAKGAAFTAGGWATQYTPAMMKTYPSAALFTNSFASMVAGTWLGFIPTQIVTIIAGMWVASFAMTTLDTTNRLARYTLSEMFEPLKGKSDGVYKFFTNKWVASIIPAAIGIWLGWSGSFAVLWPSFGSANQLIASIALLTGTAWITKRLKSRATMALVPAVLLWITVTAAIVWFSAVALPATISSNPATGIVVLIIEIIMFVMNIVFIIDFFRTRGEPAPETAKSGT
jgi:carbon starvation protein